MKKIKVTARKWNGPPLDHAMLLSIIRLTESKTHSIKFCLPVGSFLRFRVQIIAMTKTISAVINLIMIDDRLNTMSKPNTFQLTRGSLWSMSSHLFHYKIYFLCKNGLKTIKT